MSDGRKPQKDTEFRVANCTYCVAKGSSDGEGWWLNAILQLQNSDVTNCASSDLEKRADKRGGRPLQATACMRHLIAFQQNLLLEIIYRISFWVSWPNTLNHTEVHEPIW